MRTGLRVLCLFLNVNINDTADATVIRIYKNITNTIPMPNTKATVISPATDPLLSASFIEVQVKGAINIANINATTKTIPNITVDTILGLSYVISFFIFNIY